MSRRKKRKRATTQAAKTQLSERQRVKDRLEKRAMRNILAKLSAYDGARSNRLTTDWSVTSGSPDTDLLADLPLLRERSRELIRNDGLARSAINAYVDNVVGSGLRPQIHVDYERLGISQAQADEYAHAGEESFARWSRISDSTFRVNSFGELQREVLSQRLANGDTFSVPLMLDDLGREYSLAIELVEADRVSTPSGHEYEDKMRDGVEIGGRGEPVAYHVRSEHPGNQLGLKPEDWTRVQRVNISGRLNLLHHYVPTRGSSRGEPLLTPVLREFHDRRSMLVAERVAARASACIAMVIQTPTGEAFQESLTADGLTEELQPGLKHYLAPGETLSQFDPKRTDGLAAFIEITDRTIGQGVNLSYGTLTRDTSKSNFSNARTELIADRRVFTSMQKWLAASFCQPYLELHLEESWLRGELPMIPGLAFYDAPSEWCRCDWVGDGWDWVDPLKDVNATVIAIENGLESRTQALMKLGRDPERIQRDLEREAEARAALVPEMAEEDDAEETADEPQEVTSDN